MEDQKSHPAKKPKIQVDAEKVRRNFLEDSLLFQWEHYLLRCAINCAGADRGRSSWPFVRAMSEYQSVNSALWDVSTDKPVLVAAWIFSPGGDETNLVHLKEHASNVFKLHDLVRGNKFPLSKGCVPHDVLGCSSGDEAVESFGCPALEDMSMDELCTATEYDEEKHGIHQRQLREQDEGDEEDEQEDEDEQEEEDEEKEEDEEEDEDEQEEKDEERRCTS